MQLTEHFTAEENGLNQASDPRLVQNWTYLAQQVLEPIRAEWGAMRVNDGYRDPQHNAAVGGKPTSYHQGDGGRAASDLWPMSAPIQKVFDWIRLESKLEFDKVILEHNAQGDPRCIHIQIDREAAARRLAYTGSLGAASDYVQAEVV